MMDLREEIVIFQSNKGKCTILGDEDVTDQISELEAREEEHKGAHE